MFKPSKKNGISLSLTCTLHKTLIKIKFILIRHRIVSVTDKEMVLYDM